MTETGCSYYFLSTTAIDIWQKKDIEGQNRMFACLYENHKENYFRRVIFKNSVVPEYKFREFAENAFLKAWESFNENGKAGKINFSNPDYVGFFFIIFKRTYLKIIGKELLRTNAEKEFGMNQHSSEENDLELKKNDFFSPKMQMVLNKMSENCKQLLIWRHIEGLSHDEIAKRKEINRSSSIKIISRCGKRFFDIWKNHLN
ncbi:MAG: sigma-70 family RNA polymerase sigma factor [Bacteroidetes bacterium]|nr:sigma-70 family RNA polymerase sigma factor [Bacteroidota bacterium]